jgi:hypothetical protein
MRADIPFILLGLALVTGAQPGLAYETDQFSNRLEPIKDAMPLLDEKVNQTIETIVSEWQGPRNDWKFITAIYHDLGGHHWVDKIERWAMNSPEIEHLQTSRRESIYQGHPFWATRVAGMFGVGPTIMVNGQLIGSDKMGHFFSQGRKFYNRYRKSHLESQAAEHSAYTERALFGQLTTGVYSNADLVANFEGFLFYRSLFENDIVPGKKAILAWQDNEWVIQRSFTWADYVNEYWDEALNINHYDAVLYPHMKERLLTFCPDYYTAPERYTIQDEERLKTRYLDLQLRDTSDLRLDHLCTGSPAIPFKAATGWSH